MSDRSLGGTHSAFLLVPVAVTAVFALYTFTVMWLDPAAGVSERGDEGLLYSALFSSMVELVAVPAGVIRMWRSPALRTLWNAAIVFAGILPIIVCALLWLALLLGLG